MKSVAARNNAQVNRNRPPNTGVERSKKRIIYILYCLIRKISLIHGPQINNCCH